MGSRWRDGGGMRTEVSTRARRWSATEAQAVLDEWQRSGETIAGFARSNGIAAQRLYWWKNQLGPSGSGVMPSPSLVPAEIMSVGGVEMTIRCGGEIAIEIAGVSPGWVATMVAELTRQS